MRRHREKVTLEDHRETRGRSEVRVRGMNAKASSSHDDRERRISNCELILDNRKHE